MKTVLVLRSVDKDGKSHGGFQWPALGPVECPDWDSTPACGRGLHGWLRGEGDIVASSFSWTDTNFSTRLWQVVEVAEDEIVQLDGKVKFPRGSVIFTGSREEATKKIQEAYPGAAVIGGTATAGDSGTATAGDSGTATAGYSGTATAGDSGTATAGEKGIIVLRYFDRSANRHRLIVGYVGEDGIEAGKKYKLDNERKFVEALP